MKNKKIILAIIIIVVIAYFLWPVERVQINGTGTAPKRVLRIAYLLQKDKFLDPNM